MRAARLGSHPMSAGSLPDAGIRLAHLPRGLAHATLCVTIVLQYAYVFSFNPVPELRLVLAGGLTVIHLILAALTVLLRPGSWNLMLLVSAALTITSWIPAHFMGLGEVRGFDAAAGLREIVLPLMLIWVLAYPLALPHRMLRWCAVLLTLLGAAIALTGDPVYVSGTPRLGSITGGLDQMHPSAKFMALQFVLIDLLRRGGLMPGRLAWPLMVLCGGVLIGYGGRNELLLVLVYYLALHYFRLRRVTVIQWSPPIVLVLVALASAVALQIGSDVSSWGSGRVGVWAYRVDLIMDRNLMTLVFGGGLGADLIWTPEWWWADEGMSAHNDYLHIIMEHGLVGLLASLLLLYAVWLRLTEEGRAILAGVAVNSFFANGFYQSPLLAMNLSLVLATSLLVGLLRDIPDPPTHADDAA